jgi:hypothetical protein
MENEVLLRKDLIQRFYDVNGMDVNDASTMETYSTVNGYEMVTEHQAYDNMGYFRGLFNDLKSFILINN